MRLMITECRIYNGYFSHIMTCLERFTMSIYENGVSMKKNIKRHISVYMYIFNYHISIFHQTALLMPQPDTLIGTSEFYLV